METNSQLHQLRANLQELTLAYNQEPSQELLTAIFQMQVAIQALEQSI
jgi:hypothetical protein